MIRTSNVQKRFDGKDALRDVSIFVPRGSIYGLVGSNGAGKTTLIHLLSGAYRAEGGKVEVNGLPVYENIPVKSRIAVLQDAPFYGARSDMEDMRRMHRALYPGFDDARFAKMEELFSFTRKTPFRKMSKGMRKQAAFWLLLCCGCDVLLLDEPIDGLDPVMKKQMWSLLMSDAAERGTTVLVSSHNLRELEDVCDRIGLLHEGALLFEADLAEMQSHMLRVQFAFMEESTSVPPGIPLEKHEQSGKLHTAVIRGEVAETIDALQALSPVFFDSKPMTLEEIFLFELEGKDYATKDIFS